jgi:hypothetical protein
VSVSVKMKNTGKVLRSSKFFMVQAKTAETSPVTAGMPDPIPDRLDLQLGYSRRPPSA